MTAGALGAAPELTAVLVGQVTVQGWSVGAPRRRRTHGTTLAAKADEGRGDQAGVGRMHFGCLD
jgi:uncharacterized low-complexity protein